MDDDSETPEQAAAEWFDEWAGDWYADGLDDGYERSLDEQAGAE